MKHNETLQLTAQNAAAFWVPSALRAPAATELERWVTVVFCVIASGWQPNINRQRLRKSFDPLGKTIGYAHHRCLPFKARWSERHLRAAESPQILAPSLETEDAGFV